MRIMLLAGIALLLAPTPSLAQKKRRNVCPAGTYQDLGGCRPVAAPAPAGAQPYRSCPLDFAWNARSGTCTPVVRCPYNMAEVNGRCEVPQWR